MPDRIHRQRPTRLPRARLLAAAALLSGVLVAGCGGNSASLSATVGGGSPPASTAAASGGAASSGSTAQASGTTPLAFAKCMRANGVPNFPDPKPGGAPGFSIPAGTSPAAPAFRAAQAKCHKFMPLPGSGPGSSTGPAAHTMAKLVKIAQCMRRHGVPQFPDPRTSVPSNPSGFQEISNFDGAILLFPSTINMQSPAYRRALTACGAPPLGLPH
jgi:hypothetical protein